MMQQHIRHIRHELSGQYSSSEIAVLTRLMLEEVCRVPFASIMADKINHLSRLQVEKLEDILSRLKRGEPYQYVFGVTAFYGREFRVNSDVLIPRPETEELVEWVVAEHSAGHRFFLDIGTGSGCIAITLAKEIPQAQVDAWDISEKALAVAAGNAFRLGADVHFTQCDILAPFTPDKSYDVIVSNPPYVTESEKAGMDRNVLDFEPHQALFVPEDEPLLFFDRIAALAMAMLHEQGKLYVEINMSKADAVARLFCEKGFTSVEIRKDISGNARMIRAVKTVDHG
jgi:release factor glutamine methyltransferase